MLPLADLCHRIAGHKTLGTGKRLNFVIFMVLFAADFFPVFAGSLAPILGRKGAGGIHQGHQHRRVHDRVCLYAGMLAVFSGKLLGMQMHESKKCPLDKDTDKFDCVIDDEGNMPDAD